MIPAHPGRIRNPLQAFAHRAQAEHSLRILKRRAARLAPANVRLASTRLGVVDLLVAPAFSVRRTAPAAHSAAVVEDRPAAYAYRAPVHQAVLQEGISVGAAGRRAGLALRAR